MLLQLRLVFECAIRGAGFSLWVLDLAWPDPTG
jgi:hypothetical protein